MQSMEAARQRSLRDWIALAMAACALLCIGCDEREAREPQQNAREHSRPLPTCVAVGRATPVSVAVEVVARDLVVPWAMDFAPDGRLFFTERMGRIRVIEDGALRSTSWATLPVSSAGEEGLMGIALAPDFAQSGGVFVVGTFAQQLPGGRSGPLDRLMRRLQRATSRSPFSYYHNRIYRLTERGDVGVEPHAVVDNLPSNRFHAGAALAFGPDGMLYSSLGDATDQAWPQQVAIPAGKILRYRPDGSVPEDNPFPGSPVYALGLRNPQGLAWHPQTGDLVATEHGPTGDDEINRIRPGANYGWPLESGKDADALYQQPLLEWTPSVAPSGIAVYTGQDFPWRGDLLVGALGGRKLIRVAGTQVAGGWAPECTEDLLAGQLGRIRAVKMGPDGRLYLSTSNRDGRGQPRGDDDRILRLVPAPP